MRLINVSTRFPLLHCNSGQKTLFMEKICNAVGINYRDPEYFELLKKLNEVSISSGKLDAFQLLNLWQELIDVTECKRTTIRQNPRVKEGDQFQFAIWSKRPYTSPVIRFTPPLSVIKMHTIEMTDTSAIINNIPIKDISTVHNNDGLNLEQFISWFEDHNPFKGKIIQFADSVKYH